MKKTWNTPELTVYGTVQELTQKTHGLGDAIIFDGEDEGGGGDDNNGGGKGPFGSSL